MRPNFALIERRLADNEWWYGQQWSIMDAYINWVWFRVTGTAFDADEHEPCFRSSIAASLLVEPRSQLSSRV